MKKISVLVVDDSLEIHNLYKRVWKNAEIESAFDGKEALEKFQEKTYDVIFCDYHMPNMNGLELLKTQRPEESLVISNSSDEDCNKNMSPFCDLSWAKKKNLPELLAFLQVVEELVQNK